MLNEVYIRKCILQWFNVSVIVYLSPISIILELFSQQQFKMLREEDCFFTFFTKLIRRLHLEEHLVFPTFHETEWNREESGNNSDQLP